MKGACSFSGDTGVLMADGSTKPIDEVQLGDKVWATDPETGEEGARVVTHLWVHFDTLTTFSTEAGDAVTTEDHPFWNATDETWQGPQEFDTGDQVRTADGQLVAVGELDWDSSYAGLAYNLTVDDIHTYYVDLGDTTALVHSKGDSCRRPVQSVQSQAISNATDAAGVVRCRSCKGLVTQIPGRPNSLNFDHVLAFVRGGSRSIDNIVVACRSCNPSKGAKLLRDWLGRRR